MYNALNDFTDKDKVAYQYHNLLENRFKSDMEIERYKSLNTCIRTAIRDLSVWLIVIVVFIIAFFLAVC